MAKQEGDQATQRRNKELFIYKTKQAGFRKSKTGPGTIHIQDETGRIQKIKDGSEAKTRNKDETRNYKLLCKHQKRVHQENKRRNRNCTKTKQDRIGKMKDRTGNNNNTNTNQDLIR